MLPRSAPSVIAWASGRQRPNQAVIWQNLELDDKHESRQLRLGLAIITFIVGGSVTLVVRQKK